MQDHLALLRRRQAGGGRADDDRIVAGQHDVDQHDADQRRELGDQFRSEHGPPWRLWSAGSSAGVLGNDDRALNGL